MKKNNVSSIRSILVFLILLAIGIASYVSYCYINKTFFNKLDVNNKSSWQKFKSKNEGFTLLYPPNWVIDNSSSTNCGSSLVNGSKCRERFDLVSPDGILVRYVENGSYEDVWSCGAQVACPIDVVKDISELSVPNYGKMYLIKTEKINGKNAPRGYYYPDFSSIDLHIPTSPETMPKVGENIFKNYSIDYSLPSRFVNGERFSIFVDATDANNKYFRQLTSNEFYNLLSVKQAEEIIRSISY